MSWEDPALVAKYKGDDDTNVPISPKDPLGEMIETFTYEGRDGSGYGTDDAKEDRQELKEVINQHYISYEELDRLIGEDDTPQGKPLTARWDGIEVQARNELRAELKAALKKRRESKWDV